MAAETTAEWRGRISETVTGHGRRLKSHAGRLDTHEARLDSHDITLAKIVVKIGLGAAVGSLIGGGLVTMLVYIALGFHGPQ